MSIFQSPVFMGCVGIVMFAVSTLATAALMWSHVSLYRQMREREKERARKVDEWHAERRAFGTGEPT